MEIVNSGAGEGAVDSLKEQSQENSSKEIDVLTSIDHSLKILLRYFEEMLEEKYTEEDLENDND